MTIFLHAVRLALPTLFFGYAVAANLSMLTGPKPAYALPADGLLSGGLTREADGLYKQALPHMDLSRGLIGVARYALLGEARTGALVGRDGWLFSTEEARALPTVAQQQDVLGAVSDVHFRLRSVGVDLVVVPLPAKIDIHRDHATDPVFGQRLAALLATFSEHLADRGIDVVDARSAMLNPDPQMPPFFPTDTHWTPHGATLVAGAVADSGLVATGKLAFVRVDRPAKTLTGDLIQFVTTTDLAPGIGLPRETVVPFVQTPAEDAGDIFGAVTADIVLVGTSYSANPDWGFADALMLALGRDVISLAEQGLGPLQPMQDYLDSARFTEDPPAVVIWEIPIRYLTDPALWPATAVAAGQDIAALHKEHPDG